MDSGSPGVLNSTTFYLEELQQASARDFVSIYFFLSQAVWMKQFRNKLLQLLFEVCRHIWEKEKKKKRV